MYKLQREAWEGEDGSDVFYRLLECLVRLVWRSDELALPTELLVIWFWRIGGGPLTATCVVGVIVARPRNCRALIVLAIMLPLQTERKRQSAQRGRHTHALPDSALLLAHRTVRAARALAVPPPSCSGAARVVVVLDVGRLLVGVLALPAANAQDAEKCVEESAGAAEQAQQEKE